MNSKKIIKGENASQKGITLIALVITIIVLLILAGVTIRMVLGDEGIIQQATDARETNDNAAMEEKVKLSVNAWSASKYAGNTGSLADFIEAEGYATAEYDAVRGVTVVTMKDTGKTYDVATDGSMTKTTVSTAWYKEETEEFTLDTKEELNGLSTLVNSGNTFEGKTIKLEEDLKIEEEEWTPIGTPTNKFKGTFDGNGNGVDGLELNGWDSGLSYGSDEGLGLFSYVENATIKNLEINNSEIVMEAVIMAPVAAYAYGDCVFENITVANTSIANYNWYTGGIVGYAYGGGTQTYRNIDIKDSVTISGLWGTYDCCVGGIIGGTDGETNIVFENCNVAAKLDVFNDLCSNYRWGAYRYSGMLIGHSGESTKNAEGTNIATASYLTATNCTVTYDDWANYTYCNSESYGGSAGDWKYRRVQPGNGYDGLDLNHTHNEGEQHNRLMVFDQLFGGATGTYGNPECAGVTVVYNNR